ncbi:MAG: TonB-dependent receptor [Betaproteobacteria bacterium]|nr:TonB-dependent receptor [Betaproteobacteria bacterium]
MLALPMLAYAQEATLSGTVTDTTGGALPGVTVRAVHEASGNSFEAATDERGGYRLAVRVGTYRLTADLAGFAPVARTLTLLVGQQAVANLQMSVSGVQESVTVTGEAPLLDVTGSSLGGNIDPRQLQELPVNGRNWMDLAMLAPGARDTQVRGGGPSSAQGTGRQRGGGDYQLNVDGQSITNLLSASDSGQPKFSRDAIAEFELLSSRFDATQGRSSGVQVNAVTKSGTNQLAGTFSGYFRHDKLRAADLVTGRNLPYENQQLSGTFGGPIRRDRLHFFGNYEYEREPQTAVWTTPFPKFNIDLSGAQTQKIGGGRVDAQFSPRTRLTVRTAIWRDKSGPSGGSSTVAPSSVGDNFNRSSQYIGTLTQVLSSSTVNEIKGGYVDFFQHPTKYLINPNARFFGTNGPLILLTGFTAGGVQRHPQDQGQRTFSVRDDFTYSFAKGGRHTVKLGGEYLQQYARDFRCTSCDGELTATRGPLPANLEDVFPELFNAGTWRLNLLSSISSRWRQSFGPSDASFDNDEPRYVYGAWVQDDWAISPRLTLNLGLRYDVEFHSFANDVEILPFRPGGQPDDLNNVGPRLGFSWSVNDRTVVRGGGGLYYGTVVASSQARPIASTVTVTVDNDGRSDFASNPWNGAPPSYGSLQARLCTTANVAGCIRPELPTTTAQITAPGFYMPYSREASIGFQRQLADTMAVEADYVYVGSRDSPRPVPMNLTFNPATGANYPFSDVSRRPYPEWGWVRLAFNGARANLHQLQTAFTKRMSNGWQVNGTYTTSMLKDQAPPPRSGLELVPFRLADDLASLYTLSVGDQRHRATLNGIWQLRYGFQLSGLYFYGSGERFDTRWGPDLRQIGAQGDTIGEVGSARLRPNGTIVSRNSFVGKPIHRVDLRIQRRFPLGGRAGIDGLVEVFNAFNHKNFGSYVTQESSRTYGQPQRNTNVAYAPRTLQLGFRLAF